MSQQDCTQRNAFAEWIEPFLDIESKEEGDVQTSDDKHNTNQLGLFDSDEPTKTQRQ